MTMGRECGDTSRTDAQLTADTKDRLMANSESLALPCKITRSGFSNERVFRIEVADGSIYVGACPRQYCFTGTGQPLKENQPAEKGKIIEGLVLASRVREEGDGIILVSVPDGAVLPVKTAQIQKAPREVAPNVPVQP